MNQLNYHIAVTRNEELLRPAASYRLARQVAEATKPALRPLAARSRRSSRRTIRGLAATLRVGDRASAIPSIRGQA